ncbi:MAG: hypothetical protein OXB84_07015 [Halobacteriovoraceae bacterium]|nr:hypothetical protein [Halobacteriovoraceae bacterium]
MKLKVATWNMAHWSRQSYNREAWEYFSQGLGGDILLFQESVPNFDVLDKSQVVWRPIGGTRNWGSGIYSRKYKIKEYQLKTDFIGAVTAAEVEIGKNKSLIFVSLYGLFETILKTSYSIPNLHRMFSDLTGPLEGIETRGKIVIGGDFNASLQCDKRQRVKSHKVFFDRLKEFKLHNCFEGYFDDFVQTHRHSRSNLPWQNDYFFISDKLKENLLSCSVIDNDKVRKFSDHNPVVIELRP